MTFRFCYRLGLAALGVTTAVNTAPAHADSFEFTVAASHPPASAWVKELKDFVVPQSIARAAELGHDLSWTEAYAGSLFKFDTAVEALGDGIAELAWVGTLWQQNAMPLTNVTFYAPFGTGDTGKLNSIQDQMHATLPALTMEWEDNNIVYLGQQVIDGYVVLSKDPVTTLEDLKGMKLMAPGAVSLWAAGAEAVGVDGGLPVYYNNLKTGVADGALVPGSAILPFKLHEVAPYVTEVDLGGCICGGLAMNRDVWNSLPQELQTMFRDIGRTYGARVADAIGESRARHFEILAGQGVSFSILPEPDQKRWARNMPNIAAEWVEGLEARDIPARDVLDTFMQLQRDHGVTPLRDWDRGL